MPVVVTIQQLWLCQRKVANDLLWRFLQVVRPDAEASEGTIAQGKVSFKVGEMVVAGQHTFVAEWREHRVGLPQVHERSPASSITISPGQPADAQVLPLLSSHGL